MDPRGRRTRAALHRAIFALIRHKPIAEITVAELCREAAIHRTTFYKHYATVADFVGQVFADAVDDLIAIPPGTRFGHQETAAAYREAVRRVFAAVIDDRLTYRRLLGPEGDVHVQRAMLDGLRGRFTSAAENCLQYAQAPIDPAVAGAALAGSTLMVAEQIAHSETVDADAMVDVWRTTLPAWFADGWGTRPGEAVYAMSAAAHPGGVLDVVILAGGAGRRLGGVAKADLPLGDARLLDHILSDLAAWDDPRVRLGRIVVVAPETVEVPGGVLRTLEDPPGGGPAAGVAAALELLGAGDLVAVLTCDAPYSARALPQLMAALAAEGAVARNRAGFTEYLLGIYRFEPLIRRIGEASARDVSARRLFSPLSLTSVDVGDLAHDVDTWDDLAAIESARPEP